MYGNSQQKRGWALRLMKMFWERKPKINMCSVCGEKEEKMILFLTNSNQVEKCCKGQPSSFGQSFFFYLFFLFYSKAASSTSQWDFTTDISDMPLLWWQFPLCPDWTQSILHSLLLIKQPAGCFITPSQCAAENLQFKVFSLLMNSVSTARPLACNLPGESDKNITTQIYFYLPALMCQMFVSGTNLMRSGTLQSFYMSGSVYSSQRALLSLLRLWKQLYNIF